MEFLTWCQEPFCKKVDENDNCMTFIRLRGGYGDGKCSRLEFRTAKKNHNGYLNLSSKPRSEGYNRIRIIRDGQGFRSTEAWYRRFCQETPYQERYRRWAAIVFRPPAPGTVADRTTVAGHPTRGLRSPAGNCRYLSLHPG